MVDAIYVKVRECTHCQQLSRHKRLDYCLISYCFDDRGILHTNLDLTVKCQDTEEYNQNNQKFVQGDVSIRIGAKYTESAELPDPNDESQWKICDEQIGGRITKELNGYVYIEGAGGSVFWVNKDDVVYPPIP